LAIAASNGFEERNRDCDKSPSDEPHSVPRIPFGLLVTFDFNMLFSFCFLSWLEILFFLFVCVVNYEDS